MKVGWYRRVEIFYRNSYSFDPLPIEMDFEKKKLRQLFLSSPHSITLCDLQNAEKTCQIVNEVAKCFSKNMPIIISQGNKKYFSSFMYNIWFSILYKVSKVMGQNIDTQIVSEQAIMNFSIPGIHK